MFCRISDLGPLVPHTLCSDAPQQVVTTAATAEALQGLSPVWVGCSRYGAVNGRGARQLLLPPICSVHWSRCESSRRGMCTGPAAAMTRCPTTTTSTTW